MNIKAWRLINCRQALYYGIISIMNGLTFYTKPGCHLCEDGQWLLEVALRDRKLPVTYVDITTSPALTDRYGHRIPVLSHPHLATELDWPFTPESILAWLDGETA